MSEAQPRYRAFIESVRRGEPDVWEQFERAARLGASVERFPECQRLAQRHIGIEREPFVDQSHRPGMVHRAGERMQQSGQNADQARFADPVRARHMHGSAFIAGERKPAKQQPFAAAAGNILCDEASLHGRER